MVKVDKNYTDFLIGLKKRISSSRYETARTVNRELILLYWDIGNSILQKQESNGWGKKIIHKLSIDLAKAFPEMKGFSERNLDYMRHFAKFWPDREITQQLVAKLPWGHNIALLQKVPNDSERLWYAKKALENGWSRNILVLQIESNLKDRICSDQKTHNFDETLLKTQSDLANSTLKDPYIFDFLSIGAESQEREIEIALVDHIQKFLLELGAGFAFMGRQVHLDVGGQDFYLDLLFYHTKLHCYVVIELKTGDLKSEYVGKLNFYLSAVDVQIKAPEDKPTIGILLCKTKNKVIAEYALKDISKPIGISEYRIGDAIPGVFKLALPTIEELEKEFEEL